MPSPGSYPRWSTDPDNPLIDIVEPSEAQKDEGWNKYQKPPYNTFNWLQSQTHYWIEYLDIVTKFGRGVQIRANHPITFSAAGVLAFTSNIEVIFPSAGDSLVNFIAIADSTKTIPNGSVIVFRPDFSNASTQLVFQAVYANLDVGEYAIVAESSLTDTNNDEIVLFRRRDVSAGNDQYGIGFTTFEVPLTGQQYITDSVSGVRAYLGGAKILDSVRILDGDNLTMYADNGTTQTFKVNGANGDITSPVGAKHFFDNSGNGYIQQTIAGEFRIVASGDTLGLFKRTGAAAYYFQTQNVSIHTNGKLILDGNTPAASTHYLYQDGSDNWKFVVGGFEIFRLDRTAFRIHLGQSGGNDVDVSIVATKKFHFDTFGDTYMQEFSSNELRTYVGNQFITYGLTNGLYIANGKNFFLNLAGQLCFDAGAQNYFYSPVLNQLNLVINGTSAAVVTASFFSIDARDFAIQTGRKLYFDGGIDTYAYFNSGTNEIRFAFDGTDQLFNLTHTAGSSILRIQSTSGIIALMIADIAVSRMRVGTNSAHDLHLQRGGATRVIVGSTSVIADTVPIGSNTSSDPVVSPLPTLLYSNNGIQALCVVRDTTGGGGVVNLTAGIVGEHNIASVIRSFPGGGGGAQQFDVVFKTALPTANYLVQGSVITDGTENGDDNHFNVIQSSKTVNGFSARLNDGSGPNNISINYTASFFVTGA